MTPQWIIVRVFLPALVASVVSTSPSVAAAPPAAPAASVTVQPASISLARGASTTVTVVAVVSGGNIGAWTVDMTYDPAVLTATACVAIACNTSLDSSKVRLAGAALPGLTGSVTLGTVTFRATGATGTFSALHPVVTLMTDDGPPQTRQPVTTDTTDGRIAVTVGLTGDASADCAVDVLDFSMLLAGFGGKLGEARYDSRVDFDNSNSVDIVDFSVLLAHFGARC